MVWLFVTRMCGWVILADFKLHKPHAYAISATQRVIQRQVSGRTDRIGLFIYKFEEEKNHKFRDDEIFVDF